MRAAVFAFLYAVTIIFFVLFSPTCLGMVGVIENYRYINWLPAWQFSVYTPIGESAKQFIPFVKDNIGSIISKLWFSSSAP